MTLAPYFDVNQPIPGLRSKPYKGYVLDLPADDYRRFYAVNNTTLKEKTPCEMFHRLTVQDDNAHTDDRTIGTLLHWAVLEPWHFDAPDEHMICCSTKSVTSVQANGLRHETGGKLLVVTPAMIEIAARCREAILYNPRAVELLQGMGKADEMAKEATAFVWDPAFEIWVKSRVDVLPCARDYLLDVKTTRRHPAEFKKDVWQYGYHLQAAWYHYVHELLTGERRKWWCWIVVNKQPKDAKDAPSMCRVVTMANHRRNTISLYEETVYAQARQRLGLEESKMIGRLPMFVNSAREHEEFRSRVETMTAAQIRSIWPAYEQEQPEMEILT